MNSRRFEAVLMMIVPRIVNLISENMKCSEIEASKMLYASQVYAMLEDEETKLWHLSPMMLFTLFEQERSTGSFTVPEEA